MLLTLVIYLCVCLSNIVNGYCGGHLNKPELLQVSEPLEHGEEPTWDERKNILFFVDIHLGRIYSYNYYTTEIKFITLNGTVTPVIPAQYNNNLLIAGLNRSLVAVEWDGTNQLGKQKILTTISKQFPESRFNDGKADSKGRLWIGTMGPEDAKGTLSPNQGILYQFPREHLMSPLVEVQPVNVSNGLAWNRENNKFYYIDSPSRKVAVFDFDSETGKISNRQVAFDLKNYPELVGVPDGMTIDQNDNLWIALYGGGSVIQVSPKTGKLLQQISIPAKHVTSTMFGGPNLDILFVTTSRLMLSPDERKFYPAAGSVFAVKNLNVRGKPVFNANVITNI